MRWHPPSRWVTWNNWLYCKPQTWALIHKYILHKTTEYFWGPICSESIFRNYFAWTFMRRKTQVSKKTLTQLTMHMSEAFPMPLLSPATAVKFLQSTEEVGNGRSGCFMKRMHIFHQVFSLFLVVSQVHLFLEGMLFSCCHLLVILWLLVFPVLPLLLLRHLLIQLNWFFPTFSIIHSLNKAFKVICSSPLPLLPVAVAQLYLT